MAERHGLVVLSPASGVLASLASRPTEELLDTLEGLERSVRWTWLGKDQVLVVAGSPGGRWSMIWMDRLLETEPEAVLSITKASERVGHEDMPHTARFLVSCAWLPDIRALLTWRRLTAGWCVQVVIQLLKPHLLFVRRSADVNPPIQQVLAQDRRRDSGREQQRKEVAGA